MQPIPSGSIFTPGFLDDLNISHGLLPIRVVYPTASDSWERLLIVYDNAGRVGAESQIDSSLSQVGAPSPMINTAPNNSRVNARG